MFPHSKTAKMLTLLLTLRMGVIFADYQTRYKIQKSTENRNFQCFSAFKSGGRYKTRTCDLPHVKRMRYQLRQSSGSLTACLYYTMKDEMSIPFLIFFVPLRGRKIKIKNTENRYLTVLGILAQKEGFEPSRALYTPTPLAGEPLRPLGYFCMPLKYDSTA